MKQLVFTFFLLLVIKLSNGQERVYNSEKTFSIIPVEGWKNYSKENNIVFAQKHTSIRDRYQENIQVLTHPADDMTLDELWDVYVIKAFPKSFENYKFKQMWKSNINGINANWIEFTNTGEQGQTFYNLVYVLVKNNIMYYIICLALEKDFKSVEKDFRKMINSFKIE